MPVREEQGKWRGCGLDSTRCLAKCVHYHLSRQTNRQTDWRLTLDTHTEERRRLADGSTWAGIDPQLTSHNAFLSASSCLNNIRAGAETTPTPVLLAGLQNELAHLWQPFWGHRQPPGSAHLPRLDLSYIPNELGVAFRAANGSWRWLFASSQQPPSPVAVLPILLQVCHFPGPPLRPPPPPCYIYERSRKKMHIYA